LFKFREGYVKNGKLETFVAPLGVLQDCVPVSTYVPSMSGPAAVTFVGDVDGVVLAATDDAFFAPDEPPQAPATTNPRPTPINPRHNSLHRTMKSPSVVRIAPPTASALCGGALWHTSCRVTNDEPIA
jgi:hypothetical protein